MTRSPTATSTSSPARRASSTGSWSASSTTRCAKQTTLFTAEERRGFIADATAEIDNVEVEVFAALLVDFARDQGAGAIVKGLRAISDFEYEFEMAQLNRKLDPTIESIYVIASPHYSFLSSTGVKEMATFGGDVSDLVPPSVAAALAERLGDR